MNKTCLVIAIVWCSSSCLALDEVAKENEAKGKSATTNTQAAQAKLEVAVKLDENNPAQPPSVWMQQKLKHSQKIFAGLVEGDMFAVEDAARNLKFINRLENFVRGRTKAYRTQLRLFQHANAQILKGAEERNAERVLLGYQQMTVSCVTCHQQLRNRE